MSTKRLTREERREKIRRDLLEAATDLFAERGYFGVSVDEIAERAGVTKGAVYSNFTNKEQLLLEVTQQQRIDVDPDVWADVSLSIDEFAYRLGKEIARLATSQEQRKLAPRELEVSILAVTNKKIRDIVRARARAQRINLGAGIKLRADLWKTELPYPPEELAVFALALVRGLMQQRFIDPQSVPPEYFADALALLFSGSTKRGEHQGHP